MTDHHDHHDRADRHRTESVDGLALTREAHESVVVGIDGSPASRAALRWALRYAVETGAAVRAVTAWERPPVGAEDEPSSVADLDEAARARLTATVEDVAGGFAVRTRVLEGDPAEQLLDSGAQLLVLGNSGHGALAGSVLGSVAMRCVRAARCPVVLVPAAEADTDTDTGADTDTDTDTDTDAAPAER